MTRQDLMAELERCALAHGFPFRTGPDHVINARIGPAPEIWAGMPELLGQYGRNEGRRTYRIVLRMTAPAKDAVRGDELLDRMTGQLAAIALSMYDCDDIVDIPATEYQTEKDTLTNKGEVSVKATLTINTRF